MTPRHILDQLGLDPKKSLGQSFMVEAAALEKLADAADLSPDDAVLEIGAGLGALTSYLAARARRVLAIEIDGRLIPYLTDQFAVQQRVEIIHADILEADLPALLGADAGRYKVVANLPYYITSPIIRLLLESVAPPALMVLTVQREVAERITAVPPDMSMLAVSVQVYGSPRIIARLGAGNFYPSPDVDSAILRIDPYLQPRVAPDLRAAFFRIVRAGFSQPRKQIHNCLAAGLHLSKEDVVNWLAACGIDPRRRAETLNIAEWLALMNYRHQLSDDS